MTHKDFKLSVDVGGNALAALPSVASTARAAINLPSSAAPVMWWDGGERAITAREKGLIEEHSKSCFSIPLVPATSLGGDHPVAWLITWKDLNACTGEVVERRSVFLHNAVADFRTIDPSAGVTPLYATPPAPKGGRCMTTPSISCYRVDDAPGLDPITVYVENYEPGKGRMVVTCYASAWTAFWGAMGVEKNLEEFVASCSPDYVADNMVWGTDAKKPARQYADKVAAAVVALFRAQREAAERVAHD